MGNCCEWCNLVNFWVWCCWLNCLMNCVIWLFVIWFGFCLFCCCCVGFWSCSVICLLLVVGVRNWSVWLFGCVNRSDSCSILLFGLCNGYGSVLVCIMNIFGNLFWNKFWMCVWLLLICWCVMVGIFLVNLICCCGMMMVFIIWNWWLNFIWGFSLVLVIGLGLVVRIVCYVSWNIFVDISCCWWWFVRVVRCWLFMVLNWLFLYCGWVVICFIFGLGWVVCLLILSYGICVVVGFVSVIGWCIWLVWLDCRLGSIGCICCVSIGWCWLCGGRICLIYCVMVFVGILFLLMRYVCKCW